MAYKFSCNFFFSRLFIAYILLSYFIPMNASDTAISSYIVHTDIQERPSSFSTQDEWYSSMINSLTDPKTESISGSRIFYTYDVVFHGFAARLTGQEAERFTNEPGVLAVLEDKVTLKLDTTRSPDFIGLNVNYGLWPETNFGENVIIGFVDSGIWPESESFKDTGLGPVPSRWKGVCEEGTEFNSTNCNKKLIGARFFLKGMEHNMQGRSQNFSSRSLEEHGIYRSPRDEAGHGTHTSSTAAGAEVANANLFGFANGTARGMAMRARIAMYKACGHFCVESDIVAAIESAIEDKVDILSISLGSQDQPYHSNSIAKGAFAAVKRNIFVSCSAGNSGPHPYSTHNTAPWITTVGAGSMDRSFPVQIQFGNNKILTGSSIYAEKNNTNMVPLVYLGNCRSSNMIPHNVKGKIVVCNTTKIQALRNGFLTKAAGGEGLIQLNQLNEGEELFATPYTLPAATMGYKESLEILSYMKSNANPTARFRFHNITVIGKDRAPISLTFSARGPNPIVPEILKPDLIAPGQNILAAWPSNRPPTLSPNDSRRVKFNMDSGTSMSCPHVSGVAALIRAAHPNWSPAAIRSALMTTSAATDNKDRFIARYGDMEPATPLSIGAGHVNPNLAADPGLIYDADVSDYINFLCSLKYTQNQMRFFVGRSGNCSSTEISPGDLNYPSFSVVFKPKQSNIQELKRTVTNVGGLMQETYKARIVNPEAEKVIITVKPRNLIFNQAYEKQSYVVTFKSNYAVDNKSSSVEQMVFGSISWESDSHVVRSPFSVMWEQN